MAVIYSFGAGLLGAACALAGFVLWRDHQRVTAMWNLLSRPQSSVPAGPEKEVDKGKRDKLAAVN